MCTPMAAILRSPTHTPVSFGDAAGGDVEIGQRVDEHFFDGADVRPDVALPIAQVENG